MLPTWTFRGANFIFDSRPRMPVPRSEAYLRRFRSVMPMTKEITQPPSTRHYGWVIVGTLMLIQTVGSGLGFYNMAVYINRLSAELALP